MFVILFSAFYYYNKPTINYNNSEKVIISNYLKQAFEKNRAFSEYKNSSIYAANVGTHKKTCGSKNRLMLVKVTNMRRELQSQNRVNGDYEKTTSPIYFKF